MNSVECGSLDDLLKNRVECMSLGDLRGRVGDMLGSDYTAQELELAIEILKGNGYTVGEHTKPELYDEKMRLHPIVLDDVNEFWPENMFDLILEKQNKLDAEIEKKYSFLDTESYDMNIINNFCEDNAIKCSFSAEYIFNYLVDIYFPDFTENVDYKRQTYHILNYFNQYTEHECVLISIKDKLHLNMLKGYSELCVNKNIEHMQYNSNVFDFVEYLKFDTETIKLAIKKANSLDKKDFLNIYNFETESVFSACANFYELINEYR